LERMNFWYEFFDPNLPLVPRLLCIAMR
jgi:hypothetical protein